MGRLYAAITGRAAQQHGLIARDQLDRLGAPSSTLARWLETGRLQRIAPSVYRIAGTPETWHQRVMAATLDSGGWASHRAAAALHGLDGHPARQVEVVVPRWKRSGAPSSYVVHETKDLRGVDLDRRHGIPCTGLVRTLLDLPAVEHVFRVEQALDHSCRHDADLLARVGQRFVEVARRGRNGTAAMRRLLNDRSPGWIPPGSSFEARALRLMRRFNVPEPLRQYKVVDGAFVAYLDYAWPQWLFFLECDSLAHHFSRAAQEWDRQRRRRLKQLGWDGVEWSWADVTERPETIGPQLNRLLVLASTTSHMRRG